MSDNDSDSGEVPELPADTLAILQQFQKEQTDRIQKFHDIAAGKETSDVEIQEDWQLSQFWYDENTSNTLSKEAIRCAGENGRIALISCPTLYRPIVKEKPPNVNVTLFEYDTRFSVYGEDFHMYDYNAPLDVPRELSGAFDLVIADPPFLSEECLSKVAATIKFLAKSKIILCTGVIMEELAKQLLDVCKSKYEPRHKNNLGNDFGCFVNYDLDSELK